MECCKDGNSEVDDDYAWFLNFINESNEQTKSFNGDIDDEDENDIDPEYSMFLKALTENGKSYKLNIFSHDEVPLFLEYCKQYKPSEYEPLTHTNIGICKKQQTTNSSDDTRGTRINQKVECLTNISSHHGKEKEKSMEKGSLRLKTILERNSTTVTPQNTEVDSCYEKVLDGSINLESAVVIYEANEENDTSSDSDIIVWDGVPGCSEANNTQLVTEKEDPRSALKKKLKCILRQPYSRREYKTLLNYVKKQRPVGRTLDLRHRAVSSALDGSTRSLLGCFPNFRKKFLAARNERPKALNLLRGFRFWLEHLPSEGVFKPWRDKKCQKILPSENIAKELRQLV